MEPELRELLDKQAIAELLYAYAEGIDRCDSKLLETVFTGSGCASSHQWATPLRPRSHRPRRSRIQRRSFHVLPYLTIGSDGLNRLVVKGLVLCMILEVPVVDLTNLKHFDALRTRAVRVGRLSRHEK